MAGVGVADAGAVMIELTDVEQLMYTTLVRTAFGAIRWHGLRPEVPLDAFAAGILTHEQMHNTPTIRGDLIWLSDLDCAHELPPYTGPVDLSDCPIPDPHICTLACVAVERIAIMMRPALPLSDLFDGVHRAWSGPVASFADGFRCRMVEAEMADDARVITTAALTHQFQVRHPKAVAL